MATLTAYATSGDGLVRNNGSSSWATLRNAATGTVASQYNPTGVLNDGTTADKYVDRAILCFDLSSLPAGTIITAATLSVYGQSVASGAGGSVGITSAAPASTTTLATSDFGSVGTTEYVTRVNFASLTAFTYNDFALNAAGLTYLGTKLASTAGFALRGSFDLDNSAPGTTVYSNFSFNTTDASGTSQDPKLVIDYTLGKTTADAWAWSDSSAVSGSGGTTFGYSRAASDTWAWSDVAAPTYRRSTTEVVVTAEGPNTDLGNTWPFTVDLTGATTITVSSTTGFASSGTAYVIDNSTSTQQQAVFTYTGKTGTTFTGCSVTSLIGSLVFYTNAAVGAPNAESHFPQITKLDETATPPLLVSYQQHGGHGVLQGKLTSKKSLDGGMTWGSEVDIVSGPASDREGVFGHTVCRLKNGRLLCLWYEHSMDYPTADSIAVFAQMMCYSDDQGVTWSTPVELATNFGYSNRDGTCGFSSMLYTGAGSNATYGDVYVPVVGNSDGIQIHSGAPYYRWFSKLYKITDGGAGGTWTSVSTLATTAQTGGYANGEADIVIAENGTWVAHLRVEDGAYSRWQATSTDQGVTWSGHAKVIDYLGNAGVLTKLPGGTLVSTGAYYTGAHPGETASFVSPDNGTTWPANVKREAYDATYSVYNGADADVVIDDPAVLVNTAFTYAQERSNQAGGRTMFRWYVDPVKRATDAWAWSDTAARSSMSFPRSAGTYDGLSGTYFETWAWSDAPPPPPSSLSRTTSDTWAWSDAAVRSADPAARSTSDTWAWSDTAADTYVGPHYYSRTTSDIWAWSESTGALGMALYWLRAARRRSMSATTKTYTVVQAKGTARTATWTSPTYESKTEAGILVSLDVTAASGTGGLTLRINAHDLAGSTVVPLNTAPTAVTAIGTTSYALYPFGAISGAVTQSTSGYLPRQFSITVTHSDSSSYTYSIGYCLLP